MEDHPAGTLDDEVAGVLAPGGDELHVVDEVPLGAAGHGHADSGVGRPPVGPHLLDAGERERRRADAWLLHVLCLLGWASAHGVIIWAIPARVLLQLPTRT